MSERDAERTSDSERVRVLGEQQVPKAATPIKRPPPPKEPVSPSPRSGDEQKA